MLTTFKLLFVVLLLANFAVPKPLTMTVETHWNWNEQTSEKTISKALKKTINGKGPHNYFAIGDMFFSKAYLNYLKTGTIDTLSFNSAIENCKKAYTKTDGMPANNKAEIFFKICLSYYYEGNYKNAETWCTKYKRSTNPLFASLLYAKCFIKLNDTASADSTITNYSQLNGLKYDSIKKLVLTDIKNGH